MDVACKNGDYYFYFSHGGSDFGVMRATVPTLADARDELRRPLATQKSVHGETHPYDPTVLVDDDAERTAFIMFGLHTGSSSYLVAKLNQTTMQGFAEAPRKVVFLPRADGAVMAYNDKSTLHKRDGIYYLSSGTAYSTAAAVYGPYTFRGNTGPDRRARNFGLTTQAHGRYFTWQGQWFHVYCEFISQNNTVSAVRPPSGMQVQGTPLSVQPCQAGYPAHGAVWQVVPQQMGALLISADVRAGNGSPLCVDIAHPKALPVNAVYAYPCTNASNELWDSVGATVDGGTAGRSTGKLKSAQFSSMCLGRSGREVVDCDGAPVWTFSAANGQLSTAGSTREDMCLTVAGSAPSPAGPGYARYRDTWMTYTHFRLNGEMVDAVGFLDQDNGRLGVGQYDAAWAKIEVEWFLSAGCTGGGPFSPSPIELNSTRGSTNASAARFGVRFPASTKTQRPYLTFPHVHHFPQDDPGARRMTISVVSCPPDGRLDLMGGDPDANSILGSLNCSVASGGGAYIASIPYSKYGQGGLLVDIALVYTGETAMVLDWFNLTVEI